jgi:diaminopimelate epimerase
VLQYCKYQGLGNDFLMVDGRGATATDPEAPTDDACLGLSPERIRRLCDRRFGIGADGLIVAAPPREGGELRMRIFNADGSEPEMCGNGIRCLARFLADSDGDLPGRRWQVETLAGRIVPELQPDGSVRVDMGQPFLAPETVPTTLTVGEAGIPQGALEAAGERFQVGAAGMGNPHVVIPVPDVDAVDLERFGAALEVHPAFPARTNVHFVQMLTPTHLVMRVWERGAGPTLACGTGACATLVVCHALGLAERSARVDLPGGSLQISWDSADDHVWMTGPAEAVFDAVIAPSLWDPEGMDDLGEASSSAEAAPRAEATSPPPEPAVLETAGVDCATVCVQGCIRPDDCPSAAARARVEALLSSSSLDDLVNLAANSLENRIRARAERPSSPGG